MNSRHALDRIGASTTVWASVVVLLALSGCFGEGHLVLDGTLGGSGPQEHSDPDDPSGAAPVTGPTSPVIVEPVSPTLMRRLSSQEYLASVAFLLQHPDGRPAPSTSLPGDFTGPDTVGFSFTNYAPANEIGSSGQVSAYREAARAWTADLLAPGQEVRRDAVVGCDAATTDAVLRQSCLEDFVSGFGRLVFRRALSAEETLLYGTLARSALADANRWTPVRLVIEAMLQSPNFLFRIEEGVPDQRSPGLMRLRGEALATRLAFTLWGRTPDAALLDAAERGELDSVEGLRRHATQMLTSESGRAEAKRHLRNFVGEWLQLQYLDSLERSPEVHPLWSETLRDDMVEETHQWLQSLAFDDGADFLGFIDSRESIISPALAELYGVPAPSSPWERVELPAERTGLLTRAAFLTATARDGNDPIHRGYVVTSQLLCSVLPAPPAVPDPPSSGPPRERLAQHRTDIRCSGCHASLDGVGISLERFDEVGAYREFADFEGYPNYALTGEAEYPAFSPADFAGGEQLAQRLRASPKLVPCFVSQVFRRSFGHKEDVRADASTLQQMEEAFRTSSHSYRELLLALVTSDSFRFRRPRQSSSAPVTSPTPAVGTGLRGEYFDELELMDLAHTRLDPKIDFAWTRDTSPSPEITADSVYSVRWMGELKVPATGTYTFTSLSDDGVRVFIDEATVLENWTKHAPIEDSGRVVLSEGFHSIRIEYFQNGLDGVLRLEWEGPDLPRRTLDTEALFPPEM